ncbi:TRAP transporter small permease subunit [Anaerobacillus sp. MEB173]|uniref:TRAP transporter small permease subunit n=1 Tax=Anaerobacillus sp. MEB173 TaxID=3383345 RepID=UPI003F923195
MVFNKVKKIGLYISGISVFLMMFFIVADVFIRNILNSSISGNFEFVKNYFMPMAVFPALAFTFGSGILPRINIYIEKMREQFQRITAITLLLFEMVLFLLLTYYGWQYAVMSMEESLVFSAGGNMYPLYPAIFLVPLGFGLVTIEIVFLLIKNIVQNKVSFKALDLD